MNAHALNTTDLPLSQIMTIWPLTVSVFISHKMLCVGCWIGPFHTITDACAAYHLDEAAFRRELEISVSARSRSGP